MRKLLAPALLGTALVAGLTTGCTALLDKTVAASEVEAQIAGKLAGQLGGKPRSVSCPADLRGEVGATLQCSLVTADGTERVVNITVTSVDGDQINYDIKSPAPQQTAPTTPTEPTTPTQPTTPGTGDTGAPTVPVVTQAQVEAEALRQLAPQLDGVPRSVVCPGDLRGEVGVTMECTLHFEDGTWRPTTITVTSVVGTTVNFNIRLGGAGE
ncbi:protein of unknown function [Thermomonospora echinospora]|uniref:DUF4333 domain-containing protein n=1 Tax=Thermomonospora echinospora TaxID=1992 RepID=A0A1H6BYU9_9ACTN|nr:DUF4333 domain-containing protein [Thermomonospora echinospora]SEG65647.1 protein of unknown function [Thermomonospora echinospora]